MRRKPGLSIVLKANVAVRHLKKSPLCSLTTTVRCKNIYAKLNLQYADNEAFGMLDCGIHQLDR